MLSPYFANNNDEAILNDCLYYVARIADIQNTMPTNANANLSIGETILL